MLLGFNEFAFTKTTDMPCNIKHNKCQKNYAEMLIALFQKLDNGQYPVGQFGQAMISSHV